MNNPYIPPESENKKIARRLIDMGVFDCSEEDELKGTQIYYLQDWLINALDERIDYLSKKLQKEKDNGRYQKACHKWFMRWREAKKDALYFDSSLQKQIEATLKLQKDYQELEKKNHAMLENSLKICNQSEIDNDENERKIAELEEKTEKLIDFVLSKTECCDICPITDTCINSEGTCPYAGILAKGEEEVTREWLMQFISRR